MKKIAVGIGIIILIALIIILFPREETDTQSPKILKIGVILPLSGNNSFAGETTREGIEFYRKQHPSTPDFPYEIIYEDDQLMPARTALAANKLIRMDQVDFILTVSSAQAFVVAPLVAKTKTLHFSIASDITFTNYANNYVLTSEMSADVHRLLSEIKKRKYKRIALFSAVDVMANLAEKDIKKYAPKYDLDIVFESKVMRGVRDFRIDLIKAEAKKPDIYIIQTVSPELEIITRQLREKSEKPVTALFYLFFSRTPRLFEGQFGVHNISTDPAFIEEYQKAFHRQPDTMQSFFYTIMSLVIDAGKSGKHLLESQHFIENYQSTLGKLYSPSPRVIYCDSIIQEIKNGQFITVP